MIEATPWGQHPKFLVHDRDRVYGADFATRIARLGIESILPLSERQVRSMLAEFVTYDNQARPHRSLGLETPVPSRRQVDGEVVSRPVLNGLRHVYERAA